MEKTLELGVNRRVSKLQMRKDQDVEGHMDAPYAGGGRREMRVGALWSSALLVLSLLL